MTGGWDSSAALEVVGLTASYGSVPVVFDVSFRLEPGEAIALLGRNGAGKTTSLAAVAGIRLGPGGGVVRLSDRDLSRSRPLDIVQSGVRLVQEGRRVFRDMTVLENLRLGAYSLRKGSSAAIQDGLDQVMQLFPGLARFQRSLVGQLSGGQQQMVAIGQALMSRPKLLLLDEPASGLAPALVDEMYEQLSALTSRGLGVLVVDQSIERAVTWSDRYLVMEAGRLVLSGTSDAHALDGIRRVVLGRPDPGVERA
jgi:branched-chain amino acid transport system ATP-binding protein